MLNKERYPKAAFAYEQVKAEIFQKALDKSNVRNYNKNVPDNRVVKNGGRTMNGLQYIRKSFGMTLAALGKRMGITRQTISQWEQGTCSIPVNRLKELSAIFEIPENFFGEVSEVEVNELKGIIDNLKSDMEDSYWFSQYESAMSEEQRVLSKIDYHLKGKKRKFDTFQANIDYIEKEAKKFENFVDLAENFAYPSIIQRILAYLMFIDNDLELDDPFGKKFIRLVKEECCRIESDRNNVAELRERSKIETELF